MKTLPLLSILPLLLFGSVVEKKPILFSKKRIELTREYLKEHYGIEKKGINIVPKMIIIHWTALPDLESSFRAFYRETLHQGRQELLISDLNVSAHFLVDRNGDIYQLMPLTWMARHCIGLNHCSIAIENVGGERGVENLTDRQVEANARLIVSLKKQFPSIAYLIGHYEYLKFASHPLFIEKKSSFRTKKIDPGSSFMQRLRKKLTFLSLKGS